jgi:hypothetical protein
MMTRVQILLTEEQDRRLEALARQRRVSKASLVREGVDLLLRRGENEKGEPLLTLIGQAGPGGPRDLSINHDKYLVAWKRRRNR